MKKKWLWIGMILMFACSFCGLYLYFYFKPKTVSITWNERAKFETYLKNNYTTLNLNNATDEKVPMLDEIVKKFEIILCGEEHATSINYQLQFYLIQYLNNRHHIRYILTEDGYASAKMKNIYLKTGDQSILNFALRSLSGTASGTKEYYEFLKKLYRYNQTKKATERIQLIGIDIEHQTNVAVAYLHTLLPNSVAPKSIGILNDFKKSSIDDESSIAQISTNIQRNPKLYRSYLKANYDDFQFVIRNILAKYRCYRSGKSFSTLREKCIRENFDFVYLRLPKGKYFGQWGLEHAYLSDHGGHFVTSNSLATYLNHSFALSKGKVGSIALLYQDSERLDWNDNKSVPIDQGFQLNVISSVVPGDLALIRFDKKNSPFYEKPYFVANPKGLSTVDYYQYAIYVRHSKANHLY